MKRLQGNTRSVTWLPGKLRTTHRKIAAVNCAACWLPPGCPEASGRKRELLVLTLNQRDALKQDGRSITVLPAWEWLD